MSVHVHSWTPIADVPAGYRCECGAAGRRDWRTGEFVEVRDNRQRVIRQPHGFPAVAKSARLPSMDEQEARLGAPPWESQ